MRRPAWNQRAADETLSQDSKEKVLTKRCCTYVIESVKLTLVIRIITILYRAINGVIDFLFGPGRKSYYNDASSRVVKPGLLVLRDPMFKQSQKGASLDQMVLVLDHFTEFDQILESRNAFMHRFGLAHSTIDYIWSRANL